MLPLGFAVEQLVCRNSDQTPISRFIHGAGDEGGQFFFINKKSHGSGQATEPIIPELVISPKDGKTTFDDILKAEQEQREVKEKWGKWQEVRETEYREALEIDESENLTPKQKAVAWQRFLAAVSQDNPYSGRDDEIRTYSRSRATHWEDVKPVKKPETLYPAGSEGEVTARDGALVAYATGVVYDKNTGLEWLAGPDRDTRWDKAKSFGLQILQLLEEAGACHQERN